MSKRKSKERTVIHIDMDAYFASIEQRDIPKYQGSPLLVCHTDDIGSNRGVVATSSYEARPYGVKSGMTVLEAKSRLPHGTYIKGNYAKYLYNTKQIIKICSKYSDQLEVYSVDELFLDITNTSHLFGGPLEIAEEIRRRIAEELRLSCSIGIGPNKLVAKMASDMRKPMGLTVIKKEDLPQRIAVLPIGDLVGVGRRMEKHLSGLGIKTLKDITDFGAERMKSYFGLPGLYLWYASQGIDPSPICGSGDDADIHIKSFGHSSSLPGKGEKGIDLLTRLLLGLTDAVVRRMRKKNFWGRRVTVRLRLGRLFSISRSRTIPYWSDSTNELFKIAVQLFLNESPLVHKYGCTNIGVSVGKLISGNKDIQLSLFDGPKAREKRLARVTDEIKDRFGDSSITRCSLLGWNKEYQAVPAIELKRFGPR